MDKAALFAAAVDALPTEDVEIPGVGTVTVRGLSRSESLLVGKADGLEATERAVLRYGLVEPALTDAEIRDWFKIAPNAHIEPITTKIAELSGMLEDSAKAAYKSDGGGSEPGVRDVPGAEAVDDGGDAAGADER